jgi:polyisoprenoid-binding protein YceI
MRKLILAAAIAALAAPHALAQQAPAPAATMPQSGSYKLDKRHAKILWGASHFGFSTYYGQFTDFDASLTLDAATPANSKLSVTVQTTSLATNDPALDKHLNSADFFDTAAHPTATFTSKAVRRTGARTADVTGDFTLLGVTKPLTLAVTFNGAGVGPAKKPVAGFSATGTIKRSDYGMKYAIPNVADEVKLIISGEFNPA